GTSEAVNIDVSRDGGATWTPVAAGVPNSAATGSYPWTVTGPATSHARIRVSRATDPSANDVSDVDFAIVVPTVTVTSPNGSGSVLIGSTRPVTFTQNLGVGQAVNLDVSRDGGATWEPITALTTTAATSGSYVWVVTAPATTQTRIRAS